MLFLKQEQEFRLRAEDVDRLKSDDFYEQNIIDELRIVGDDSVAEFRDALPFVLFDRDSASEVSEPLLLQKLDQTEADVLAHRRGALLEPTPVLAEARFDATLCVTWPLGHHSPALHYWILSYTATAVCFPSGVLNVTVSVFPSFDTTLVAYCVTCPSLPL